MHIIVCGISLPPVSLGVVGRSPQSLNAEDLTQFLNMLLVETSTSVTQEPGLGAPKIEIKPPTEIYVMGFCSLIGGHICQYIFSEMVLENQDIGYSR